MISFFVGTLGVDKQPRVAGPVVRGKIGYVPYGCLQPPGSVHFDVKAICKPNSESRRPWKGSRSGQSNQKIRLPTRQRFEGKVVLARVTSLFGGAASNWRSTL